MLNDNPVIFFDGVCNLCNSSVQFIIRHDPKERFRFAALQSDAGKKAVAALSTQQHQLPDSIILLQNGKYYTKSTAALLIARQLSGLLPLLYAGIVLPSFIRDSIYNVVAKNRYKWFGKQNECMMPTATLKQRFL